MALTKVKTCTCRHEWQDGRYGKGMRVHNECKLSSGTLGWRCTVCSRETGK